MNRNVFLTLHQLSIAYIENSGSYTWNIPQSLQDSGTMPEGDKYGFKILDDATGTYEYSPPFDISVPGSTYGGASGTSDSSASSAVESTSKKATSTSAAASTSAAQKTTAIAQSTTVEATATPTVIQEQPVETEASAVATTFATKTTAAAKATSTSADTEATESQGSPPNILFIAGIGAGGIVLCGFIILGLCMCCRSKKRKSTSPIENTMSQRHSKMYGNGMYNRV